MTKIPRPEAGIAPKASLAPPEKDPRQPAGFDPVALGRMLLREARTGALGTLDRMGGHPSVSLVSTATDLDGAPILLVSGLSHHTKNLAEDKRASLLLSRGGKGDPLAHPRLTLIGEVVVARSESHRRRFLARHPKAQLYVDFPDFSFLRFEAARMQINGGFARAFDGPASHILAPEALTPDYAALEASAIEHLNGDHKESLTLYAQKLLGLKGRGWRATGLDPRGLDLAFGDQVARLPFETPIFDARTLRLTLKDLAEKARAGALV